ncbi:F-box/kelch-repeat protein [Arabidopsis thaliana]
MTMMFDLTQDLVEEILSRVPITSLGTVRSTCKGWNALSKDRILCKAKPKQQFHQGFMLSDYRLRSMRFNISGTFKENGEEFVNLSIKEIGNFLNKVEISHMYYCDGILLCVTTDTRLVIWNLYLGQIRWIQLKTETMYSTFCLRYDNNKNHKILRFLDNKQGSYKIYDLKSYSWRAFDVIPKWDIDDDGQSASVKGNTYFRTIDETPNLLICFDFTAERFGKLLDPPFQHGWMSLSWVREEKLVALYQHLDTSMIEIWITAKIEPNALSWTSFLKCYIEQYYNNFFIDEEKKLAVVIDKVESEDCKRSNSHINSYIIGDDGYLKKMNSLGNTARSYTAIMLSSCTFQV